jgi:EcsC protein family
MRFKMKNSTESLESKSTLANRISDEILRLVASIPSSNEALSEHPQKRADAIAKSAILKASLTSGTLALPAGPLGMLTIIPDLLVVWKIQSQMVADIAAVFGKKAELNREAMIYCLFKHAASQAVRDLVVRAGERFLIKKASLKAVQSILQKIGVKVTQRLAGKSIARWLPFVGAVGVAAYAYYDTRGVANAAIELFSNDIMSYENTSEPLI